MKMPGRYFPEEYRAFCRGELSANVERFGGINSLKLLDVDECEGKLYPERFPICLFDRKGESGGRPLFSSAIRFYRHTQDGAEVTFVPEYPDCHPFGFDSKEYSFLMHKDSIAAQLVTDKKDRSVFCTVSKEHFVTGTGNSLKNQQATIASGIQWLKPEDRGEDFDPAYPFADSPMTVNPPVIRWDRKDNMLKLVWTVDWADHSKEIHMYITADHTVTAEETESYWKLEFVPRKKKCAFGFGIGYTSRDAKKRALDSCVNFDAERKALIKKYTFPGSISLSVENLSSAKEFAEVFPAFQNNMIIAENENEAAIRAASDKFGYFCMWDQIYPTRDFLLCGNPEMTKKSLRYMCTYPHMKTSIWSTIHLVITLNEYLAVTGDTALRTELMPYLKEFFSFAKGLSHPEKGLVKFSLNMGVDASAELGLSGMFYSSCINGWWYDACRVLENLAMEEKDKEFAKECAETAARIEACYEEIFFRKDPGYLISAVTEELEDPKISVYQNTHTAAADYVHGYYLFRKIFPQLASYQARKLYHPLGHLAFAYDDKVPCDMWKAVHMNQHLGHECRTARMGGNAKEAFRVMQGYFRMFDMFKTCIETFNYTGCVGNCSQTSNWQTFSATASMQALIHGVIGVEWHRGGICYLPGQYTGEHTLKNFRFRKKVYSFRTEGKGEYAQIYVNGKALAGTLQFPADICKEEKKIDCVIRHSGKAPDRPVLYMAIDLPVSHLKSGREILTFRAAKRCHAPVRMYSPMKPVVTVNDKEIAVEWDEQTKILWFDREFKKGDKVTARIGAIPVNN